MKQNKVNTTVVIIGGGITGLSVAAQLDQNNIPFILLERKPRLGGQIKTIREKGYVYEVGPNTGSISTPEVVDLFDYAKPLCKLVTANADANSRWIWKGQKFHSLPSNPIQGLFSPLFSFQDKLNILLEPFRKKGDDADESVGALAERRLGKSFVDYAVDPFIGGIYAGDPYKLTTRFALPKLYNLEQNYGSFIGGAIKLMKTPKDARQKKATKEVFSAENGLESLVDALSDKIKRSGQCVTSVRDINSTYCGENEWCVTYNTGDESESIEIHSKYLVTTVPSHHLERVLPQELIPYLPPISSLVYAPMIEVTVGFDHLPHVRRNAFGGLVPSKEKRKVLGILFPSSCFKGRTPNPDSALFTIFMGGLRNGAELWDKDDDEVIDIALAELYDMMKISNDQKPDLVHLSRYSRAIPQYDHTSKSRVDRIVELQDMYRGLFLCGGIRDGIGLAHRITQGVRVGDLIASECRGKK